MRVYKDQGVEQAVVVAGRDAVVLVVNAADGSSVQYLYVKTNS